MINDRINSEYNFLDTDLHQQVIDLLDAYSTYELEPIEQAVVEKHLIACSQCQTLLMDIQQKSRQIIWYLA